MPLRGSRKFSWNMMDKGKRAAMHITLFAALAGGFATTAEAKLQCVPYAREVSGIEIHGNARTWWDQAGGQYKRGKQPEVGAVLTFRPTSAMPLGHVAVVSQIVDDRTIILDHANWSRPGMIEHHAMAVDVSPDGDWSEVRVWYAPIGALGSRTNPTFGFIYNETPGSDTTVLAAADGDGNQDEAKIAAADPADSALAVSEVLPGLQRASFTPFSGGR